MTLTLNRSRSACVAAASALLWLLSACGGGTQVEKFVPTRVLSFGDESSMIDDSQVAGNGRKYSVNAVTVDPLTLVVSPDCVTQPVWNQYVASYYNLVFPQCRGTDPAPASRIYATFHAKVADVAAQVALAGGRFGAKDLATLLVGTQDLIDIYEAGGDEATMFAAAGATGSALAQQVIDISRAGAKVLFSTVPDLGQTPYAIAKDLALATGTVQQGRLSRMTDRFNAGLRVGVSEQLGGHEASQMLADERFHAIVNATNAGTAGSFLSVTVPICDPAKAADLLGCTNLTLITDTSTPPLISGGTSANYLWADDRHLSAGGQSALGVLAVTALARTPL